ncbi:hypothetical protein [Actinophytocola sp.]|uniref:hypothetical protein n=1 Tax=Actinophytocola sp. TaxID=1872138 RepID=UPI002D3F3625|nr:hypothetical protein [Actinophytocola sp.]HYQ69102.1 hypothetical protein [Actinophytocola sp.]
MTTAPERCLTIEELREFLGFEKDRVIRENVRNRLWPHLRIGRKIRFSPDHVSAILAMHEQGPGESGPARSPRRRRPTPPGVDLSSLPITQRSRAARTVPG